MQGILNVILACRPIKTVKAFKWNHIFIIRQNLSKCQFFAGHDFSSGYEYKIIASMWKHLKGLMQKEIFT